MDAHLLRSFSDLFFYMEEKFANRIAFRWVEDDESVREKTFHIFCTDIRRSVSFLHEIFPEIEGQHIAILAQNSYEYVVMMYGCILAGAVIIPLNLQKSTEDILSELADSDTDTVLYDEEFINGEPDFPKLFPGRLYPLDGYFRCSADAKWTERSPLTLAAIYYTSGTTARSKGVMLHQRSLLASSTAPIKMNEYFRTSTNAPYAAPVRLFVTLPLYHLSGIGPLLSVFIEGGTANINKNPKYFFRDIPLLSSDVVCVTPIFLDMIKKKLHRGGKSFLCGLNMICTLGAPVSADTLKIFSRQNISILQMYGLTEVFTGITLNCSQEESKLSSIGKTFSHFLLNDQCAIIDSEFCISGNSLMMGYYKAPEETARVIDENGWFHTGDLVRQDEEGYYYLVGRKKNLIILSNGENINPEEIEEKLSPNADILEAVVREKNNRIVAEIFCDASKKSEIEAFITDLNRMLPAYKYISSAEFRDTPFERTSTGKIKR